MVQEMWAKLNAREKFVVYGAGGVVLGWILGLVLGSGQVCDSVLGTNYCVGSIQYFTAGNAGLFAILALVAAIVTLVALYLKIAPNVSFTWPVPYVQALLGLCVITLACAALMVIIQLTNGGSPPVLMYVADAVVVAGAAVMTWFAYQEWVASKTAA